MKRVWVLLCLLAMASFGAALAESPPDGMTTTLQSMVESGYNIIFVNRGWSSLYNLPQTRFSLDEADFYDNAADFGETGMYGLALSQLDNPEYDTLGVTDDVRTRIPELGTNLLSWIWTPASESFGTQNGGELPNGGVARVQSQLLGIVVTDNICLEESLPYNEYAIPLDTLNKIPNSNLQGIAGTGIALLNAAKGDTSNKVQYETAARQMGNLILASMITPENESFGFHPSEIEDKYGHSIPEGMIPYSFSLKTSGDDTYSCGDGGSIKLNENRKTFMALAGVFLNRLADVTGDESYARGADYVANGILTQLQCDGSFVDYTRWEGPGIYPYVCKPDDGSPEYEAYPSNVAVSTTGGYIIDSALILSLLRLENENVYQDNSEYRRSVAYFLELEESELGSGFVKNGDPLRYASYSLDIQNRAYAQMILADVFLRASCQETNVDMERRLQTKAYHLINGANTVVPAELDYKIGGAFISDVGLHAYAVSAAADAWKILARGCDDCQDVDGDGYIDGVCAGDTVKYDCNDNDPAIHPGAVEVCDLIDNDCDGVIDDGFDFDGDTYSICSEPVDCNDDNGDIYPGAPETIDNIDNDCNLIADDTGVQINVINDANQGIANVDLILVDYGNACINAFSSLVDDFELISSKCTVVKRCTTDANGYCLMPLTANGKFQALGVAGESGLESGAIEFTVGGRNEILLKAKGFEGTGIDSETLPSSPSILESNPYLGYGILVILLVVVVMGGWYMQRTGKLGGKGKELLHLPSHPAHGAKASKPAFSLPKLKVPKMPHFKISIEVGKNEHEKQTDLRNYDSKKK